MQLFPSGTYAEMWNQQLENLQVESSSQETDNTPAAATDAPTAAPAGHHHLQYKG